MELNRFCRFIDDHKSLKKERKYIKTISVVQNRIKTNQNIYITQGRI